ncbi:MAG: U32 family peptidase [Negativicutes bacterium]|nr:U32 family peptidase [Negativicutes bacterium]
MRTDKIELLAPAGNMEKLKFALRFGADAVYCGGKEFSLRASAGNFTLDQLADAVKITRRLGKKLYVTVNVFPHEADLRQLRDYIGQLGEIGPDALIVADAGVWQLCRTIAPEIPLFLSTQANVLNSAAVEFWRQQGARRIILAREVRLADLRELAGSTGVELEVFCHGAMCIAYSGRCLLSAYFNRRSANLGECTHPCRWEYHVRETTRQEDGIMAVEEDPRGTYLFASRDLCLLPYLPDLIDCGIASLKIEGRMKSLHYVATVCKVYRQALDCIAAGRQLDFGWARRELSIVAQRSYTTGFIGDVPDREMQIYRDIQTPSPWEFAGVVVGRDDKRRQVLIEQRNKISLGDQLEFIQPQGENIRMTAAGMTDELHSGKIGSTPHPLMRYWLPVTTAIPARHSLLRVKRSENDAS